MLDAISLRNNEDLFYNISNIQDKNAVNTILKIYFQELENSLADKSGRVPAKVVIYSEPDERGSTNPSYNYANNELKIFYPNNCKPIEYLMTLHHESEHADQNLSPLKTNDQKILYQISKALYVLPKSDIHNLPLGYRCNYKELEAKLREVRFLIESYKKIKERDETLSFAKGRYYRQVFKYARQSLENRMPHDIRKLMLVHLMLVHYDKYRKAPVKDMEKKDIVNFLLKKAPKLYKEVSKQIISAYKELKKIEKELEVYSPEKIKNTLKKIEDERLKELNKLCQHPKVKKVITAKGHQEIVEAKDYKDCAEQLKELLDNPNVLEVFVLPSTHGDNCALLYVSKEKSIADEIFDDNFMKNDEKEDYLINIELNDRYGLGGDER